MVIKLKILLVNFVVIITALNILKNKDLLVLEYKYYQFFYLKKNWYGIIIYLTFCNRK